MDAIGRYKCGILRDLLLAMLGLIACSYSLTAELSLVISLSRGDAVTP